MGGNSLWIVLYFTKDSAVKQFLHNSFYRNRYLKFWLTVHFKIETFFLDDYLRKKRELTFAAWYFQFSDKYNLLPIRCPHKSTVKSFAHPSQSKFPAHLLFMVNNRALINAVHLSASCCGVWSLFFNLYLSKQGFLSTQALYQQRPASISGEFLYHFTLHRYI